MVTAYVPRMQTEFRTLSLRTFDRLGCAANAKIKLIYIYIYIYIDILCIFASSGGVHALT